MVEPQRILSNPSQPTVTPAEILDVVENRTQLAPLELARRADAGDDVLNYLAQHGGVATRAAVAANFAAPEAANRRLSDDIEDGVRGELARKIARLLPGLTHEGVACLRDSCVELLEKLARDHVPQDRAILAEEIKRLDCVPKTIVNRLARDVEQIVAVPILEFSPLLSDCDLIEIIADAQVESIITAIARRHPLSEDVSDAIVCSLDMPALAALLANHDAAIRAATLHQIAETAEKLTGLHELLVLRGDLSVRTIRRLASFVGSALLNRLAARDDLDQTTCDILHQRLLERLQDGDPQPSSGRSEIPSVPYDEDAIEKAIKLGDKPALIRALSMLGNAPPATVREILDLGSASPIIALVWKAGLSMRVAYLIQSAVMHLSPAECIPAREGKYFPFNEEQMGWQLDVFGIRMPRKASQSLVTRYITPESSH